MDHLPNLQSLLLSRLPFFDHQSLLALRQRVSQRHQSEDTNTTYGLKLLLATKEPNATSAGLSEFLLHFPSLVYLDLSYTKSARDAFVLQNLSALQDLQVLKVRGIGLRDGEAETLANAIGTRARVLDVRDNYLTDNAVRSLLQASFLPLEGPNSGIYGNGRHEDWPMGLPPGPDFLSLDSLRREDLDQQLLSTLTRPLTGRLAFEDLPHKGLTHLYVSGNCLSVEGISSLLSSSRLHVLDAGTVDTAKTITRTRSTSSPESFRDEVRFPGAEKLVPVLADKASQNLTYLRINHAAITAKTHPQDLPSTKASPVKQTASELPTTHAIAELRGSSRQPTELSGQDNVFELSSEPPEPRAELPGDPIHVTLTPPVGEFPGLAMDLPDLGPRRGSGVFAPEVVPHKPEAPDLQQGSIDNGQADDEPIILNATGSGLSSKRATRPPNLSNTFPPISPSSPIYSPFQPSISSPFTSTLAPFSPVSQPSTPLPRSTPSPSTLLQPRIQLLLSQRPSLPPPRSPILSPTTPSTPSPPPSNALQFHPSYLPHLRTLILTSLPTHVPASSPIPSSLTTFISFCASESLLSHLLAQTNYSLPPSGRSRQAAQLRHAKSLFALKTIILEMSPPPPPSHLPRAATAAQSHNHPHHHHLTVHRHHTPHTHYHHSHHRKRSGASFGKSSTGDQDSENMWTAAANDFSFFDSRGEVEDECGIFDSDPSFLQTFAGNEGLIPVSADENDDDDNYNENGAASAPRKDVASPSPPPPPSSSGYDAKEQQQEDEKEEEEMVDVIAYVAAFRRAKKAEYEAAVQRWRQQRNGGWAGDDGGAVSIVEGPFVEGYWRGDVRVVRPDG